MKKLLPIFLLTILGGTALAGGPFPILAQSDYYDEYPIEISKNDYIKKSYSKRDSYNLKFRMNSLVEKYLNISEDLEELKKITEKEKNSKEITEKIQRLEKLKKEYKKEYIKNYRKLKDKKGVKFWAEIEKLFPEYLEIKSFIKKNKYNTQNKIIEDRTSITQNHDYRRKHFFGHKINYNIKKDIFKKADNIFLISNLNTENNYTIIKLENDNKNNILNSYNFSFYNFLKEKEKKQTLEKIISDKNTFLAKKIEKNKGEFIYNNFGVLDYNLIIQKGDIFLSIGKIRTYNGIPSYLTKSNKKEINNLKENFFRNLSRRERMYSYSIRNFENKDLIAYMKNFLRKKLEMIEVLENKEKFLEVIEKIILKISKGKKEKIEKLMESFTSDNQIKKISKEFNKINRKSELFSLFLYVIEEEKEILDFKSIENLILKK